jgi:peptidoglycan/LPS O-acetylase OafA/YrhL
MWYLSDHHVENRLDAALRNHWATIVAKAAIGVAVSLGVAVCSYEIFEKRFLALKRFFEPKLAPPVALATPVGEVDGAGVSSGPVL